MSEQIIAFMIHSFGCGWVD